VERDRDVKTPRCRLKKLHRGVFVFRRGGNGRSHPVI
jgi:hypothetical protein